VDVANDVGFSSRQYFSSLFTRATGLSPAEFRKRQRGNIASGFGAADMGVVLSIRRD
jgi:AraC-like DNA-binding protein